MARRGAGARGRGVALAGPVHPPARTGRYFDGLYAALAASPTHALIGREALGGAFAGQLGHAGERELLRLAEVAGLAPGRRTLELCCGSGGVASWLARRTGATVTGVDCSPGALRIGAAAAGRAPRVEFAVADVGRLPFAPASFDAVICIDGFGAELESLAAGVLRVLRPGGGAALLLSLPAGGAENAVGAFREAGAARSFAEDLTEQASALVRRWLDAYRRHARRHIAEVGERYHAAIVEELGALLDGYASGTVERVMIAARRA